MTRPDDSPIYRFRGHTRPTATIRASLLSPKVDDDGVAEILLFDPIDSYGDFWGVSAKEFVAGLEQLDDDVQEIRLRINSPGGECFEAIAMMNALRNHPARVVAVVEGLAASAASVLACSADEVVMGRNTQMMIHDAWAIAAGPAALMRDTAARLDKLSDNLAEVYAGKAGVDVAAMREAMLAETWYSAEEAVAAGLADRVDGDESTADAARFDLSIFAYAGRREAPAPKLPVAPAARANPPAAPASGDTTQEGRADMAEISDAQLTTLRQTAGVSDDADIDTALAAIAEALQEQADPPADAALAAAPEGTILVDSEAFAELQKNAALGAQARQEQVTAHRAEVLDEAVRTGRIGPAARASWEATLIKDPGAEQTLAALPETIPLVPKGHVGGTVDEAPRGEAADEELYASIYAKQGKTTQTQED